MSSLGEYPRETGDHALRCELAGFQTVKVNRTQRNAQGGQAAGGFGSQGDGSQASRSAPQDDPWGLPTANATAGGRGNWPDTEPPF